MPQLKSLLPRLFAHLRLLFRPRTLLEGVDVSNQLRPPEINQSLPIDLVALCEHLVDLVLYLRPLLPDSCRWMEQGALEIVGTYPFAAGGIADVWVGMIGDRRVAIKSYRCYSSSNYLPTYVVSGTYLRCVPLTESLLAEILQRSTGV
jgi:hypothetical protein